MSVPAPAGDTSIEKPAAKPAGLGGWLILLGSVMALELIVNGVFLFTVSEAVLSDDLDSLARLQGIPLLNHFSSMIAIQTMVYSLWFGFGLYFSYLFFKKSKQFPRLYIWFMWISFFYVATETTYLISASGLDYLHARNKEAIRGVAVSIFWTVVWTTYLLKSIRVRNTFANT